MDRQFAFFLPTEYKIERKLSTSKVCVFLTFKYLLIVIMVEGSICRLFILANVSPFEKYGSPEFPYAGAEASMVD